MIEQYGSARAVQAAIRDAARKQNKYNPSVSIDELMRQETFRRLLTRVFLDPESEWLLKGGTSVLARVPNARATKDIDLYRLVYTLNQSLSELRRLVEHDIGDHFRFVYRTSEQILAAEQQMYTEGLRVTLEVFIGAQPWSPVKIDLAVGAGVTDASETRHPAAALHLPKLPSAPYRLYPVVDQIADKICATMMT